MRAHPARRLTAVGRPEESAACSSALACPRTPWRGGRRRIPAASPCSTSTVPASPTPSSTARAGAGRRRCSASASAPATTWRPCCPTGSTPSRRCSGSAGCGPSRCRWPWGCRARCCTGSCTTPTPPPSWSPPSSSSAWRRSRPSCPTLRTVVVLDGATSDAPNPSPPLPFRVVTRGGPVRRRGSGGRAGRPRVPRHRRPALHLGDDRPVQGRGGAVGADLPVLVLGPRRHRPPRRGLPLRPAAVPQQRPVRHHHGLGPRRPLLFRSASGRPVLGRRPPQRRCRGRPRRAADVATLVGGASVPKTPTTRCAA